MRVWLIVECGLNDSDWVFVFWINGLKLRSLFFNIKPQGSMLGVCRCICVWGAKRERVWSNEACVCCCMVRCYKVCMGY